MVLDLDHRTGLPEAMRLLVNELPREDWDAHPQFSGLVSFWLDRHMMFRRLMRKMRDDTEALLDSKVTPAIFARNTARYGGMFVTELHGHHQLEDQDYFPLLRTREPRIAAGFDLLDADHHALDGLLSGFVDCANGALQSSDTSDTPTLAGRLRECFVDVERQITRHLDDEEDLVVPVILKFGVGGLG